MAGTGKAPKAQIGDRVRFKDQNHINRRGQTGKVVGLIRLATRAHWDYVARRYVTRRYDHHNTLRYRVRCDEDGTILQVQGYSFEVACPICWQWHHPDHHLASGPNPYGKVGVS